MFRNRNKEIVSQRKQLLQKARSENYHREEVITTFLALLEMTRLKLITVAQRGPGAPVYVQAQVADIDSQGEEAASMLDE